MKKITKPEQINLRPKPKVVYFKDFEGERFGLLYTIGYLGRELNGNVNWLLHCDCGTFVEASVPEFSSGTLTSCGCANELQGGLSQNNETEIL
jgi:hypothetical protein